MQWRNLGRGNGDIYTRTQHVGGPKLRSEYYVIITKRLILVDANNYDLQDIENQWLIASCKISSRSPRFAMWVDANFSDVLRLTSVSSNQRPHVVWLMVASQCIQIAKPANFPTSLILQGVYEVWVHGEKHIKSRYIVKQHNFQKRNNFISILMYLFFQSSEEKFYSANL